MSILNLITSPKARILGSLGLNQIEQRARLMHNLFSPILACPYCLGRDPNSLEWLLLIAGFVTLPFIIVGITTYLIKKEESRKR